MPYNATAITKDQFDNVIKNLAALGYLPKDVNGATWRVNYAAPYNIDLVNTGTTIASYHLQFLLKPQPNKNGLWDKTTRALIPVPGFDTGDFIDTPKNFRADETVKGSDMMALADKLKAAGYIPKYGYGVDGTYLDPSAADVTYRKAGVRLLPVFDENGNAIDRAKIAQYESYDLTPYVFGTGRIYDIKNNKLISVDDALLENPLAGQIANATWWKNPFVIVGGVLLTLLIAYGIYKMVKD